MAARQLEYKRALQAFFGGQPPVFWRDETYCSGRHSDIGAGERPAAEPGPQIEAAEGLRLWLEIRVFWPVVSGSKRLSNSPKKSWA